jgi:hypothetical protein
LLARQVAGGILRQLLTQDQDRVQRRAQLVRHVRQELGLVLRSERQFGRLRLQRATGLLHLGILALDLGILLGQESRLGAEFFVRVLQLALPRLQFDRELLRLGQQALGAHGRLDGVEHGADALREQVEERERAGAEVLQRGQFDHGLGFTFEQDRQHDDADLPRPAETRLDP